MQCLLVSFFINIDITKNISDGGCNIGRYSIMVASMGRSVVAVVAMADNLAYIRASLELGQNADRAVLVHSPIRYIQALDNHVLHLQHQQ